MKLAVIVSLGSVLLLGIVMEARRRWSAEREATVSPKWLLEHRQGERVEFHGTSWNTSAMGWDKE